MTCISKDNSGGIKAVWICEVKDVDLSKRTIDISKMQKIDLKVKDESFRDIIFTFDINK